MQELEGIKKYLLSQESEDSKRPLVYPLFKSLFKDKFKVEAAAKGADGYVEGKLILELKSKEKDWLSGFFQALHYSTNYGLSFNTVIVLTSGKLAVWKISKFSHLTEEVKTIIKNSDPLESPSSVGRKNARLAKDQRIKIRDAAIKFIDTDSNDLFLDSDLDQFLDILQNIDSDRIQINPQNFISHIDKLKQFYSKPIDAVHTFYSIVNVWDEGSKVVDDDPDDDDVQVTSKYDVISQQIEVAPRDKSIFKRYIESHYVYINESSGISADYYFSRFDEVLYKIDPVFANQHGIYFTDLNLSRFAHWFAEKHLNKKIGDNNIVIDPAGGSGNLVTSWKDHLKHKIVSELQPDLLKTIQKRFNIAAKQDRDAVSIGYTIVPKPKKGEFLNFLDKTAQEYYEIIEKAVEDDGFKIDKPFAFVVNPPYKNTDQNKRILDDSDSNYSIHKSIYEVTTNKIKDDRCATFIAQILNICEYQVRRHPEFKPLVMIFSPTSWLIPTSDFKPLRKKWDMKFKFEKGFIINAKEFFSLKSSFPISFTTWSFSDKQNNSNGISVYDFTHLKNKDLNINWFVSNRKISSQIKTIIANSSKVRYSVSDSDSIKSWIGFSMRDHKRSRNKSELLSTEPVGGLPIGHEKRSNSKTYGYTSTDFIGFIDDMSPVRVKWLENDNRFRFKGNHQQVYFRLDEAFKDIRRSWCLNGFPDKYGHTAFDIDSAKKTFTWYAITESIFGKYPTALNQCAIYKPKILDSFRDNFFSLCFTLGYSLNTSVVTKFEEHNPVKGAPEVFVDNPFSPLNKESFWSTTLAKHIKKSHTEAHNLKRTIDDLYYLFATKYCPNGRIIEDELRHESYFKYFSYRPFLTKDSGLIQIKKFASIHEHNDLLEMFERIKKHTTIVKDRIYDILVNDFKYFG